MKNLPNTSKKLQGFTLVELMVVVSIIAILAVIGLTVYSNVQKGARDARRVSDVNAISSALEVAYSGGVYPNLTTSMFADQSVPVDPSSGSSICISGTSSVKCDYSITYNGSSGTTTIPLNGSTAYPLTLNSATYTLCAYRETVPNQYCKSNQR